MENKDRYIIVCPEGNDNLISFIGKEMDEEDELIITMLHKLPSKTLEKIYFSAKKRCEYLILLNSNSRYFTEGFLSDLKKHKSSSGISFKRTDDFPCETDFELLSNKLIMGDDSLCLPLKMFRGFRDLSPRTLFPDILKTIANRYKTYGDPVRHIVGYNDVMSKKRLLEDKNDEIQPNVIKDFWNKEIKKKKQEEILRIGVINNPVKKIDINGEVHIVSKTDETHLNDYKKDWNNWML